MFKRMSAGDRIFTVANYIVLLAFAVVIVLPIFCVVMNSFVSEAEIARRGAFIFIPEQWDLTSYKMLWSSRQNLIRAYGNTLFRVIVGTSMNLAFTICLLYTSNCPGKTCPTAPKTCSNFSRAICGKNAKAAYFCVYLPKNKPAY